MAQQSNIEWTDATWNPVRGCSRVSEGCRNCYAERVAARFAKPGRPFHGFAQVTAPRDNLDRVGGRRNGWTGRVELIQDKLDEPLRWKKPRRIFVNSMSDLFHERLSDEAIAAVFGVMAAAPQHTFQVLTKRPERMRRWFDWVTRAGHGLVPAWYVTDAYKAAIPGGTMIAPAIGRALAGTQRRLIWPLPNVWLGVSVEDQASFDARVLPLVSTPAALRFISYEPAIGPLDCSLPVSPMATPLLLPRDPKHGPGCVHWLIVGGESGPGARPFNIGWAYSAVAQCRAARVPAFVKQLGARPYEPMGSPPDYGWFELRDRKGGDPSEWPEDLRVREFPELRA